MKEEKNNGLIGAVYDDFLIYSKNLKNHQIQNLILEPLKIDTLLQKILQNNYAEKKYVPEIVGKYLSKIIQISYDAGNNDFVLNTGDYFIRNLGFKLNGKEKNPIKLTIQGNTGDKCGTGVIHSEFSITGITRDSCGWGAKYSKFSMEGNVGDWCGTDAKFSGFSVKGSVGGSFGRHAEYSEFSVVCDTGDLCGDDARYSNFDIKGNTGIKFGGGAKHSTFTISGNTSNYCGNGAKHSNFNIKGKTRGEWGKNANYCIFVIYDEDSFENILQDTSMKFCKISLLDKDNKIIKKRETK